MQFASFYFFLPKCNRFTKNISHSFHTQSTICTTIFEIRSKWKELQLIEVCCSQGQGQPGSIKTAALCFQPKHPLWPPGQESNLWRYELGKVRLDAMKLTSAFRLVGYVDILVMNVTLAVTILKQSGPPWLPSTTGATSRHAVVFVFCHQSRCPQ